MLPDQCLHIGGEERPLDRSVKVVQEERDEPLDKGRGHGLTPLVDGGGDEGGVVEVAHGRGQEVVRHARHEEDEAGVQPVGQVVADLVEEGRDEGEVKGHGGGGGGGVRVGEEGADGGMGEGVLVRGLDARPKAHEELEEPTGRMKIICLCLQSGESLWINLCGCSS